MMRLLLLLCGFFCLNTSLAQTEVPDNYSIVEDSSNLSSSHPYHEWFIQLKKGSTILEEIAASNILPERDGFVHFYSKADRKNLILNTENFTLRDGTTPFWREYQCGLLLTKDGDGGYNLIEPSGKILLSFPYKGTVSYQRPTDFNEEGFAFTSYFDSENKKSTAVLFDSLGNTWNYNQSEGMQSKHFWFIPPSPTSGRSSCCAPMSYILQYMPTIYKTENGKMFLKGTKAFIPPIYDSIEEHNVKFAKTKIRYNKETRRKVKNVTYKCFIGEEKYFITVNML